MKPRFSLALCVSLLAAASTALAVEKGDTRDAVIAELGNPAGEIAAGSMTLLVFPRGEIRMQDGRVSAINLVTEEELAARQVTEAAAKARAEAERAAQLARLEKQGRAIRLAKKTDVQFQSLGATDQLDFWRTFAARYPMISVEAEVAPLIARASEEERLREINRANEERLASLEARLSETEDRAARAEREAQRARYDAQRNIGWGPYFPNRPFGNRSYRRDREWPPFNRPPPQPTEQQTPPQVDDVADARAKAMADIDEARRRAYQ